MSYSKLILVFTEAGKLVYKGMEAFFNAVFFTPIGDLLGALEPVPIIGTIIDIMELILGNFVEELFTEVTIFELMIGPLCITVVVFTIFKWLKDLA